MPKLHITSLLRPRGHFKPIENQRSEPSDAITDESTEATNCLATTKTTSPQVEPPKPPAKNVEFIPTLDFVTQESVTSEFDVQHVTDILSQLEFDTYNDRNDDDDHSDNHSGHTFVIERSCSAELNSSSSTNTEELLRQEIVHSFRTNSTAESSLVYEPTSSMSIEMDNLGKSATTGTTATTTPTTTDEVPETTATSSRKNSNPSAITSVTTASSGGHSMEEEIEEAIEISEEVAPDLSAARSLELSEAAGYIQQILPKKEKTKSLQLFGIETSEEDSLVQPIKNAAKINKTKQNSSEEDELFKIDDDQLSGGKLAQHFVLDEEEDDDDFDVNVPLDKTQAHASHETSSDISVEPSKTATDSAEVDFEDLDVSLPLEKGVVHSRHDEELMSNFKDEPRETSLSNESTANDVSDLVDEPRQGEDSLKSEALLMPGTESTPKSCEYEQNTTSTLLNEKVSGSLNKVEVEPTKRTSHELNKPMTSVSPDHSEKDHSIEEIVESNHSFEYTLDDKDLSSLNPSFVLHNESLVNRLLADRMEDQIFTDKNVTKESANLALLDDHKTVDYARIVTDLDANVTEAMMNATECETVSQQRTTKFGAQKNQQISAIESKTVNLHETKLPVSSHISGRKENVPLNEANLVETKLAVISETLQLHGMAEVEVEPLETVVEHVETNESSTFDLATNALREALMNLIGSKNQVTSVSPELEVPFNDDDDDDTSLELMKLRIMAMKHQSKDQQNYISLNDVATVSANVGGEVQVIKPMERVPLGDFTKDALEDITEESERNSLSTAEEPRSLSMERSATTTDEKDDNKTLLAEVEAQTADLTTTSNSIVSLNMLQMLENKVSELQDMVAGKDACLAALNFQLETSQRRESSGANSVEQQLGSGRDTNSSLVTNSTEYRTFQEEFGGPAMDIYMELSRRDELIAKLTDSLQQSMNVREQLQTDSDKLTNEVQLLRKQLCDALDTLRRPTWPRADLDSNCGQRISEISMDLISESDDDLERNFFTDNEDKYSRNSRERQLSVPRQTAEMYGGGGDMEAPEWSQPPFSKQIEQFQKYLSPGEVRIFFMVQKKFDDYLSQELEKCKLKCELDQKEIIDQLEADKQRKDVEIKKLLTLREEQDSKHAKEVEELRKYFETKCAELEKQFSDDVFSQKSQHHTGDTSSSEGSDPEPMPEEIAPVPTTSRSKEPSPRKRTRAALLLSPSHRQITPFTDTFNEDANGSVEATELKAFYQQKVHEIQHTHEDQLRKVTEKLKYYESRYPEDEFMSAHKTTASSTDASATKIAAKSMAANTTTNLNTSPESRVNQRNYSNAANQESVSLQVRDSNTSFIIIDKDELNLHNESQVIQKIIEEYERRLQEQLALAREDIVRELEVQIQNLLSETTADDQHWPPELILLREKFTAKSQLKIAQLKIKHEEEMSRLKADYEKQLNRKNKRHLTFDSARDFELVINDRDNLRELCKSFRSVLAELSKCVVNCEDDINSTLMQEVHRLVAHNRTLDEQTLDADMNISLLNTSLSSKKQARYVPDVHSLLEVVEDPILVDFVSNKCGDLVEDFDLRECLERLNAEAVYLLHLSEELHKRQRPRLSSVSSGLEKIDSCCEGDSDDEKSPAKREKLHRFLRTSSLNEQNLPTYREHTKQQQGQLLNSLPPDLNRLRGENSNDNDEIFSTPDGNASELNFQVHELKNRLIKSETDRVKLQDELEHTIKRNAELGQELQALRDQLSQLNSLNQTDYAEGYGHGSLRSPQRVSGSDKSSTSFTQLQEKARNILSSPTQQQPSNDATVVLLQMIEDFCREGEKVMECGKKDREDLQLQIDAADKQLKATRHFLEEQAAEREQERDEFQREIERLKAQLRDKEKERSTFENASKEIEQLESQIRELTQKLSETNAKRDKFEVELKASIDKIFVLREIITELETQVETKALNEHVLTEKNKQLEDYINSQTRSNEALQNEVQTLKLEIGEGYQERIRFLEDKLQNMRPSAEQSMVLDQVVEQLRDIENNLDQKTKNLESVHHSISSNANSVTEDVSVNGAHPINALPSTGAPNNPTATATVPTPGSPMHPSPRQHSLTMEGVQRIADKVAKHTRVEEAAVKRIRDLEMQVTQMRDVCVELQQDRESLQQRMCEQNQRISTLQSRLEEQRKRAIELERAGSIDLSVRVHDLQNEIHNLQETLSVRDKQIATMKQQLEKSKVAIDRLEAELAVEQQPDRSIMERLEVEVRQKNAAIQVLKEKIKNEMINKLSLPDLMETMLADKNEEIDHLREQLVSKEKEIHELNSSQGFSLGGGASGKSVGAGKDEVSTKLSARTLSDIVSISDFDEPDVMRRVAVAQEATPIQLSDGNRGFGLQSMDTSKQVLANLTDKRSEDLSGLATLRPANTFENPHYFQDPNVLAYTGQSDATATPPIVPRQINFSALTEDSKFKTPSFEMSADRKATEEKEMFQKWACEVHELKEKLLFVSTEKDNAIGEKDKEMQAMEEELVATQLQLGGLQHDLEQRQTEISELKKEAQKCLIYQSEIAEKTAEIELLLSSQERLIKENREQQDRLTKSEKELLNYKENEQQLQRRVKELEEKILETTEYEVNQRESLRKELSALSEIHEQCKNTVRELEARKVVVSNLNEQLKAKDQRLQMLTNKLVQADENVSELQQKISSLGEEVERLRQQPNSDNSSKQYSVDEIAQQVEKELNYSVQLDSNILRAIESEEENNLDRKSREKASQEPNKTEAHGTDDENFTGERELLNQLEVLKAQISVEREQNEETRQELLTEKQHSQEIQEQDVLIIEAMRKRLETALEKEDELLKLLDIERERCERVQTQLTAMQRAESRRNSLLLKSPSESPRKSPRSIGTDFESELADRLRSEIKMLTAQNERERDRCADAQRASDRERQRYENELQERVEYCEKLKREMEKLTRDKDLAEHECEHLQERLTLQTQEIESLEARLATLQEAETRRTTRRDRQQKESVHLLGEIQEVKSMLLATEAERDKLLKNITQLRFDVERSGHREAKLAEALANANMSAAEVSVPQQFLQKMKEINALLAENTQENRQMAETVQFLVEERRQLQKKCEELESQLGGTANVAELEERCNHLLGRYLRVESHRKALVYQKRYLKISLQNYQDSEQRALAALNGGHMAQPLPNKKKLFKTVALAVVAIQRMKYIGRTWRTGKRIVSKSVFTITQQKPPQPAIFTCAPDNSTCPKSPPTMPFCNPPNSLRPRNRQFQPLKSPALVHDFVNGGAIDDDVTSTMTLSPVPIFDWPRVQTFQQ